MKNATASVWPHDHKYDKGGPLDVRLGVRVQHPLVTEWNKKTKPLFQILQPMDDSNLTIINVLFLKPGTSMPVQFIGFQKWHRANVFRVLKNGQVEVRIKTRYTNGLQHPVPVGAWQGTREEHKPFLPCDWVLYRFQRQTLTSIPQPSEKKVILTPGDEGFAIPASKVKKSF